MNKEFYILYNKKTNEVYDIREFEDLYITKKRISFKNDSLTGAVLEKVNDEYKLIKYSDKYEFREYKIDPDIRVSRNKRFSVVRVGDLDSIGLIKGSLIDGKIVSENGKIKINTISLHEEILFSKCDLDLIFKENEEGSSIDNLKDQLKVLSNIFSEKSKMIISQIEKLDNSIIKGDIASFAYEDGEYEILMNTKRYNLNQDFLYKSMRSYNENVAKKEVVDKSNKVIAIEKARKAMKAAGIEVDESLFEKSLGMD